VIGFPAHGAWQRVEVAAAAHDVAVGNGWAFRDHRTHTAKIVAKRKKPAGHAAERVMIIAVKMVLAPRPSRPADVEGKGVRLLLPPRL
jgi:hypothetical protein